jgi:ABC-2 type transport system ATP-binding protein
VIHVSKLTKYYGDYAAVRNVSFDVPAGQVVGFLGPNGAGKTTTMRILAGFLTATSGKATIDGFDVFWQPLEVRRRIGYMPENCPLYPEMRVTEYLHFRAGIKGLHGRERRKRIDYVLKRCWLTDVGRQLIGTLSKGYRQRVGLADTLLADPPVLILDEPTAGLDPSQIRETRKLIRELGQEHTLLLSTHILPEVEMTCDNVIIIHRGQVVVSGPLRELAHQESADVSPQLVVEVEGDVDPHILQEIGELEKIIKERIPHGTRLRLLTKDVEKVLARVSIIIVKNNWKVLDIRPQRQTLEELFVRLVEEEEPAEKAAAK